MKAMVVSSGWQKFSEALALTLSGMPADACLVISASGGRYARFRVQTPQLWCEIVHNGQLGERYRMPTEAEALLTKKGWSPPFEGRSVNWHRLIGWPVHYHEYELVAEQVSAVLRDALEVGDPSELEIDSWIEGSKATFGTAALRTSTGG